MTKFVASYSISKSNIRSYKSDFKKPGVLVQAWFKIKSRNKMLTKQQANFESEKLYEKETTM